MMRVEQMDSAIQFVRRVFPRSHQVMVSGLRECWILENDEIPTAVLGKGESPFHAWINAELNVKEESNGKT